MLNYHPSNDSYHAIYRLFLLTHTTGITVIEWDRLRLMDFYFLFPHLLADIKCPKEFMSTKKIFKSIPPPYEEIGSSKRLFFQLGTLQEITIRSLIAKGYFDRDAFILKNEVVIKNPPPSKIIELINNDQKVCSEWYKPFLEMLLKLPMSGKNGLKERSIMLEHRYDPI